MRALTYLLLYFLSPDLGGLLNGFATHTIVLLARVLIWRLIRRVKPHKHKHASHTIIETVSTIIKHGKQRGVNGATYRCTRLSSLTIITHHGNDCYRESHYKLLERETHRVDRLAYTPYRLTPSLKSSLDGKYTNHQHYAICTLSAGNSAWATDPVGHTATQ